MLSRLPSPRRRLAAGCGVIVLLLGCWCSLMARSALIVANDLNNLRSDLASADLNRLELSQIRSRVSSMHTELTSFRSLGGPLFAVAPGLGWLPGIGGDVKAAPVLFDAAVDLLDAGQMVLEQAEPYWPLSRLREQPEFKGQSMLRVAALLAQHFSTSLAPAGEALDRASGKLASVDMVALSPEVRRQVARLTSASTLAKVGLGAVELAPELLGLNGRRTYLVLMQNDDELRPTGGFISAAARVTLDDGEIASLEVSDSYQVDDYLHKPYDSPPSPLMEFMGSELWLFRDANWSPDFPTSARKAAELYTYGTGAPIDGVIAINQQGVREIVAGLGSIVVDPGQPPVDASNLIEYMRSTWAPPPDAASINAWIATRKDFIGKLMNAILNRLQTAPDQVQWADLARAVNRALEHRDLLVWMKSPQVSPLLAELGWDGALRRAGGDYWMLVDANLGFNKVNSIVDSSIAYTVTLQADGSAEAEMLMHYRHTGEPAAGCKHLITYTLEVSYEALVQSCYWDYVRLLTPAGSALESSSAPPVPGDYLVTDRPFDGGARVEDESGKTAFGIFFVLERGKTLDARFTYRVSAAVRWDSNGGLYTLLMQKQGGAKPRPVSVTLIWPEGYRLASVEPASVRQDARSASFEFDLTSDQSLSVKLSR